MNLILVNKIIKRLALLAFLVLMLISPVLVSPLSRPSAQEVTQAIPDDCVNLADGETCPPPRLQLIEFWVIKALYTVWAFGGLAFTLGLVVIGLSWMLAGGDQEKLGEIKKRATYWAISIPVFFGGYPAILFILQILPLSGSNCYAELNQFQFKVFFPYACGVSTTTVTPTQVGLTGGTATYTCDIQKGGVIVGLNPGYRDPSDNSICTQAECKSVNGNYTWVAVNCN